MAVDFSKYGTPVTSTPPRGSSIDFSQYGTPVSAAPTQQSHANSIWSAIAGYAGGVKDAFQQGIGQTADAFNAIGSGTPGMNPIIGGLEQGLKAESGIASAISAPVAPLFAPVGAAVNAVGNAAGSVPGVQTFANSSAGQTTSRVAEDIANAGNVAGTIAGVDQAVKAPSAISEAVGVIKKAASDRFAAADQIAQTQKAVATTAQVDKIAQEWKSPADINTSAYNKARAALDKSPDTPKFLAQQGISPFQNIVDGKYETLDTADALRTTAAKLSRDMLRPSLQAAEYSTPHTPVSQIVDAAITRARGGFSSTPGDIDAIITAIRKEGQALEAKYPNGINITQLHDEGIVYDKNGGYNKFTTNADTNKAIANRALGQALRQGVQDVAPESLPVKPFDKYLSNYFKAADYLESLNSKKAPVSTLQSVAQFVAKFGGAAVARMLAPGIGDLLSTFAGYQIGKALEHAVENMTNPMRDSFLRNLEISNPEAFQKVQDYLTNAKEGNPSIPILPSSGMIVPPAPSEASQMRSRAIMLTPK